MYSSRRHSDGPFTFSAWYGCTPTSGGLTVESGIRLLKQAVVEDGHRVTPDGEVLCWATQILIGLRYSPEKKTWGWERLVEQFIRNE
jgi:hypothetical protein